MKDEMDEIDLGPAPQALSVEWECEAELRGMSFHPPAKALLEALRAGAELELEREPTNKYDMNAVKVWASASAFHAEDRANLELLLAGFGLELETFDATPSWMLGYVGKEWAAELSPRLASHGAGAVRARLKFSGSGKPMLRIELLG